MTNPVNYHAYALILFIVADVVLIVMLILKPRITILLTLLWGGLQVGLIFGDVATGLGIPDFTPSDAFNYLMLGKGNISRMATTFLVVTYGCIAVFFSHRINKKKNDIDESSARYSRVRTI